MMESLFISWIFSPFSSKQLHLTIWGNGKNLFWIWCCFCLFRFVVSPLLVVIVLVVYVIWKIFYYFQFIYSWHAGDFSPRCFFCTPDTTLVGTTQQLSSYHNSGKFQYSAFIYLPLIYIVILFYVLFINT